MRRTLQGLRLDEDKMGRAAEKPAFLNAFYLFLLTFDPIGVVLRQNFFDLKRKNGTYREKRCVSDWGTAPD